MKRHVCVSSVITSDTAQYQSSSSSRINLPSGVSADEIDIQVCIYTYDLRFSSGSKYSSVINKGYRGQLLVSKEGLRESK